MAKKTFWTQDHSGKLYKNAHIVLSRVKYRSECPFLFLQAVYGHLWVPVLCLSFPLVPVRGRPRLPCRPPAGRAEGQLSRVTLFPERLGRGAVAEAACPTVDQDPRGQSLPQRGPPGRRGTEGPQQLSTAPRSSDGANRLTLCHTPRSSWPFGVSPAQVVERRQSSTGSVPAGRG